MASVLQFPSRYFAESPEERPHPSPSAAEAAITRARHGLRLVPQRGFGRREAALNFTRMIGAVVAQIDGEVARQAAHEPVRRLFQTPGSAA